MLAARHSGKKGSSRRRLLETIWSAPRYNQPLIEPGRVARGDALAEVVRLLWVAMCWHLMPSQLQGGTDDGRALGCGCLMGGASLQVHHSLAGVFDMKAEKEIAGTLTKLQS